MAKTFYPGADEPQETLKERLDFEKRLNGIHPEIDGPNNAEGVIPKTLPRLALPLGKGGSQ